MLQIKLPNENTPSAHSSQAAGAQTNTQPPSGEDTEKHHQHSPREKNANEF